VGRSRVVRVLEFDAVVLDTIIWPLCEDGGVEGLPSGTVSFVFTDIEGSTRIFRRLGDLYPPVLERHNELLRAAWVAHGGFEVKTEGDAFFVAFADAAAAVAACADAQRSLSAEDWPEGGEVRVRMGIHTGLASPKDGDYVAFAVHQAARVVGAAHGGQVLLSEDTETEAGEVPELGRQSLGRFRVRDFDQPVELFQVTGGGLTSEFPALRAIPAQGHNLIRPRTHFIGRGRDLEELAELLEQVRLVSIVGSGGVGKTRLAIELGLAEATSWGDGVWMVELAGVERGQVAGAVADAVGAGTSQSTAESAILDHLKSRNSLVVLDNCEHLIDDVADLVQLVLDSTAEVSVLTTSREPLNLAGETVWRPAPLDDDGIELFLDRARHADARFDADESEIESVREICRRLDGLPLAIELAAARVGSLTIAEIQSGLDDSLRLLQSRRRDLDERQRSLRGLLDWSHRLLDRNEEIVFRRLAVFAESFTVEAAEVAAGWEPLDAADVTDSVWALLDKSLLTADISEGETRYRMLESVRQFAHERLESSGELDESTDVVAEYFSDRFGRSPITSEWSRQMQVEANNIRSLIADVRERSGGTAQALACLIGRLHAAQTTFSEGVAEMRRYLAELPGDSPERLALLGSCIFLNQQIVNELPTDLLDEAMLIQRSGIREPSWDRGSIASCIAFQSVYNGDLREATELHTRGLQEAQDPREQVLWLNGLGVAYCFLGEFDAALEAFHRQAALLRAAGDQDHLMTTLGNIAETELRLDNFANAARYQLEALDLATQSGQLVAVGFSLMVAAQLQAERSEWTEAAILQFVADRVLAQSGLQLFEPDQQKRNQLMNEASLALGEDAMAEIRALAHTQDTPDVIRLARRALADAQTSVDNSS